VARVTAARHVPVLIVGAGPTGLLLAAELRRRAVECLLVDALPEPLAWDRATVVHPRSLEVFAALGIVDAFLEAGVHQSVAQVRSGGELLGEIDLTGCGSRYPFNLGMSEQVTEGILLDHLRQLGGAVERGARLVDLVPGEDGVRATLEHPDGERAQLTADWIVGCDGLHSLTRERAGIALSGHDIPVPWAVFDATATNWPEPYDVNHVFLEQPAVILTALPGRRWRVYLRPTGPDSDLVADATATVQRYHSAVELVDVADPRRFHCHTRVATRYRSGRVLLAGDAAHVCSPAEGHGMNSGIQDAFNLGWKLALVCRGDAAPALLDSYEAERRPVAERITASGDAVEGAQTMTDAAQRLARDATLRATFADADSRHHESLAEAELDIDYAGSPIVMAAAAGDLRPGARLPDDVRVRLSTGEDRLLHELAWRAGHTALMLTGPSATDGDVSATPPHLIEATLAVTLAGHTGDATLLVVRPDGHIGAVAQRDHRAALDAYAALLSASATS
jgi:2-polyprenyl-6-methoxyphenol hydroxylase-like FAD-dependent oxidoreductase